MAGLGSKEKAGCRELLDVLSTADLLALTETVTKRMIYVTSRTEAIHAIVTYSGSAKELLKRRKVQRDIIFTYLGKKGIVALPSSDKNQLIDQALEYWKEPVTEEQQQKPTEADTGALDYQVLGEQFCQWFFNLLNAQNPSLGQEQGEWGPHHFWENAVLKFSYKTSEQDTEEYQGAQMASLRLLALVREECLFMNPNLDASGLRAVNSPHGLVVVAVAGTVHRNNLCLGIFEQVFGLIRCPLAENNWKIKYVNLKIVGQHAFGGGVPVPKPCIGYQTSELRNFYS
ncbi:uncharacterized protein C3orf38 homolog [Microcaecilia unicolor]|uniref:Uncharacterized protein C3orf38 homolog n=1 Tax=Microcaecilia unicolor TaxID=1415580 RepID=A0A6P7YDU9_9AMPH|nr:uncharacterized protein C3orf38 homolog [Microcaecilia unicolor]